MDELISYVDRYFQLREESPHSLRVFSHLTLTVVYARFSVTLETGVKKLMLPLGYVFSEPKTELPILFSHTPVFDSKDGEACGNMSEFGLLERFSEIPGRPFDRGLAEESDILITISYGSPSTGNLIKKMGFDVLLLNLVLSSMYNLAMRDDIAREHLVKEYYHLADLPAFALDADSKARLVVWKQNIAETVLLSNYTRMVQKLLPLSVLNKKARVNPVSNEIALTLQMSNATRMGILDGFTGYVYEFKIAGIDAEVYSNALTRQRHSYGDKEDALSDEAMLVVMPYVGYTFYYYFLNHGRLKRSSRNMRASIYECDLTDLSAPLFIWCWELYKLHEQGIIHGDLHLNNVTMKQLPLRIPDTENKPIELLEGFHQYRAGLESWYVHYDCKHPTIIDFSRSIRLDDLATLSLLEAQLPEFYAANSALLAASQAANPVSFGQKVALLDQYRLLSAIANAAGPQDKKGEGVRVDPLVTTLRDFVKQMVESLLLSGAPAKDLDVKVLKQFTMLRPPRSPVYFVHPISTGWASEHRILTELPRKQLVSSG